MMKQNPLFFVENTIKLNGMKIRVANPSPFFQIYFFLIAKIANMTIKIESESPLITPV